MLFPNPWAVKGQIAKEEHFLLLGQYEEEMLGAYPVFPLGKRGDNS